MVAKLLTKLEMYQLASHQSTLGGLDVRSIQQVVLQLEDPLAFFNIFFLQYRSNGRATGRVTHLYVEQNAC